MHGRQAGCEKSGHKKVNSVRQTEMSALGQKRTFRLPLGMSALPPKSGHSGSLLEWPLWARSRQTYILARGRRSSSSDSAFSLNYLRSRATSARSVSDCELTDTYSPAIDMAPATNPATPAIKTLVCVAAAAATPTIKLAVETMPSLAPSTAACNHPMRSTRPCIRSQKIRDKIETLLNGATAPYLQWS